MSDNSPAHWVFSGKFCLNKDVLHSPFTKVKRQPTLIISFSHHLSFLRDIKHQAEVPGRVAQSVTCLVTDAKLTADPGVASSIPARSHTFVGINHERISTVILLPSAESFMNTSESMCTITG